MPHETDSVTEWLADLKTGRTDAAEQIWQRYVSQLVRVARRKLKSTPKRAADEEDVVLSAFQGFLNGVEDGRFLRLEDRDDLWQVLVMLTERRAIAMRRRELAAKRGGGNVRGESVFAERAADSQPQGLNQRSGREPTPAFAAEMADQLRHLLTQLNDSTHRQIALAKLEGKTNKEIAQELQISLRAVERKLGIIRRQWRESPRDE